MAPVKDDIFGEGSIPVTKAQALGVPPYIDEDDFDVSLDVEDQREFLTDVGIDSEIEDDILEDEISSIEDELIDDEVDDLPLGRVTMAHKARQSMALPGRESYGTGFMCGYMQALKDMGTDKAVMEEAYGGLMKWLGKGIGKGVKGIGRLAGTIGKGFLGETRVADVAHDAGVQLRESLEAGAETLPPVYVEDEEGVEEVSLDDDGFEDDVDYELDIEEEFGAVAKHGVVGGQVRRKAREAAHRAVLRGRHAIGKSKKGTPRPFLEDPGATPVMTAGGGISEPIYGELTMVPCPSCTRTQTRYAGMGAAEDCVVCEQYGVVLVPKLDLNDFMAGERYGIASLVIPAVSMAARAIGKGKLFPKAREKLEAWLEEQAQLKTDENEDYDEDDEALHAGIDDEEDLYGAVRCLVPQGWEPRGNQ